MSKTDNMAIWDALGKTDPKHTKQFTRAGGFKGTAIKPMWANMRMTEYFGPCGIGWGPDKPEFTTIEAAGEIMVYCTAGLWYYEPDSMVRRQVYGEGGDKVLSQVFQKDERGQKIPDKEKGGYKTYPQTDDEAFKKAYTDALSNAMKFIGVGADVHMGQFEDSKYVREVAAEFEEQKKAVVFAEVERQKGEVSTQKSAPPPELEFQYNRSSGLLIARLVDVVKGKTKSGANAGKDYLTITVNNELDKGKKPLLYYWHATHRDALLKAKGKIVKMLIIAKEKGFTVDQVMEIDGEKTGLIDDNSLEMQARLLASNIGLEEEELREMHHLFKGNWQVIVDRLKERKEALA